jgi:hypothetical protein
VGCSVLEDELASRDGMSRQDSTLQRVVESLHASIRQSISLEGRLERGLTFMTAGMYAAGMLPPMT